MSEAVREILERIEQLPEEDRYFLEERLARLAEDEWKREAEQARQIARERGLDQAAIDQAIHDVRYPDEGLARLAQSAIRDHGRETVVTSSRQDAST
jgi:hypothetical protein